MKVLKVSGLVIGILIAGILVFAGVNHVSPLSMIAEDEFDTHGDLAIKGYDPVTYFSANQAKRGREKFQFKWKNATWYFSTEENRSKFMTNPAHYAPQFGGYCAFAVSTGFSATADPTSFMIRKNKLYLFNSPEVVIEAEKMGDEFWTIAETNWAK